MNIDVCFTPRDYQEREALPHIAVVIDVLRATTSIATALYNGCRQFIPVATVEEAKALQAMQFPDALLAGEREALLIPGFQFGNSPYDYAKSAVEGRSIIMTTTNGTVALKAVAAASQVYTAAFVNAGAVCLRLADQKADIMVVCAGTQGRFSVEDTLCAGFIADRLLHDASLSDTAIAARAMYRDFSRNLVRRVKVTTHASRLIRLGFEQDIDFCLQQDIFPIAPVYADGLISI